MKMTPENMKPLETFFNAAKKDTYFVDVDGHVWTAIKPWDKQNLGHLNNRNGCYYILRGFSGSKFAITVSDLLLKTVAWRNEMKQKNMITRPLTDFFGSLRRDAYVIDTQGRIWSKIKDGKSLMLLKGFIRKNGSRYYNLRTNISWRWGAVHSERDILEKTAQWRKGAEQPTIVEKTKPVVKLKSAPTDELVKNKGKWMIGWLDISSSYNSNVVYRIVEQKFYDEDEVKGEIEERLKIYPDSVYFTLQIGDCARVPPPSTVVWE